MFSRERLVATRFHDELAERAVGNRGSVDVFRPVNDKFAGLNRRINFCGTVVNLAVAVFIVGRFGNFAARCPAERFRCGKRDVNVEVFLVAFEFCGLLGFARMIDDVDKRVVAVDDNFACGNARQVVRFHVVKKFFEIGVECFVASGIFKWGKYHNADIFPLRKRKGKLKFSVPALRERGPDNDE